MKKLMIVLCLTLLLSACSTKNNSSSLLEEASESSAAIANTLPQISAEEASSITYETLVGDWAGAGGFYLFNDDGSYYRYSTAETESSTRSYIVGSWTVKNGLLYLTATKTVYAITHSSDDNSPSEVYYHAIDIAFPKEAEKKLEFKKGKLHIAHGSYEPIEATHSKWPDSFEKIKDNSYLNELNYRTAEYTIADLLNIEVNTEYYTEHLSFWDDETILYAGRDFTYTFASYNLVTKEVNKMQLETKPRAYRYDKNRLLLFTATEVEIYSLPSYSLQTTLALPQELQSQGINNGLSYAISEDNKWLAYADSTLISQSKEATVNFYNFETKEFITKNPVEYPGIIEEYTTNSESDSEMGNPSTGITNMQFIDNTTVVYSQVWALPRGEWVVTDSIVVFTTPFDEPISLITPYQPSSIIHSNTQIIFPQTPGAYTTSENLNIYTIGLDKKTTLHDMDIINWYALGDNHYNDYLVAFHILSEQEGENKNTHQILVYDKSSLEQVAEYYLYVGESTEQPYWGSHLSITTAGDKVLYQEEYGNKSIFVADFS